jgi:hypothetical protein
MTDISLPRVDRPAFFTGERLLAQTLDDAFSGPLALHRLHNRALHGWGIAFGLDVTGPADATAVTVGAGYAIDAAGRDLVLAQPLTLAVPPVSQAPDCGPVRFALTIAFTDDADALVETRDGDCGATGAVHRSDDPTIRFQAEGSVRQGLDVVLAHAVVRNCKLAEARNLDGRRSALPAGRPHVAGGATAAQMTGWRPWPDATAPVGVVAHVPTAEAGFGDVPRYQARVEGPRSISTVQSPSGTPFVLDGTLMIDAAAPASFDAVVVLPSGFAGSGATAPLPLNPPEAFTEGLLDDLGWRVVWIGVEGG